MKFVYPIILLFLLSCTSENKDSIENNTSLDIFLTKQNSYVQIPMQQFKSGHLSIITELNNVKGRFILDTGSSTTLVDQKHRKKFKLVTQSTQKIAKTAGGSQLKMKVSHNNILKFGDLKLRNVKISLVNLSHINYSFQQMGMLQLDGIIGSDILKSRKAIIDYENLFIYLKKK